MERNEIVFDGKKMFFKNNIFHVNEKDVDGFSTEYYVKNPTTGKSMKFILSHSTGSEWDPETVWIYKNNELGLELHVSQDETITKTRYSYYLKHKAGI